MTDAEKIMLQIRAHEEAHAEELKRLRTLSMEERAAMFEEACRLAAAILDSRRDMGLPPPSPAPWPQSTIDFLKRHAPHARRTAVADA